VLAFHGQHAFCFGHGNTLPARMLSAPARLRTIGLIDRYQQQNFVQNRFEQHRVCPTCGTPFAATRSDSRYCSRYCRKQAKLSPKDHRDALGAIVLFYK
jgi:predicted nucleic acid-binding Zn ribbon protein